MTLDVEERRVVHDPIEDTTEFERPHFRGWRSPLIGPILALLALVGYWFYNQNIAGKRWDAVYRRFDHLAHIWWVVLFVIFLITVVLWLVICFEHDYTHRIGQVRMARTLGWGAILVLLVGIFASTTPTSAAGKLTQGGFSYTQQAPSNCVDGYNVQLNSNAGNRVLSQGTVIRATNNAQARQELNKIMELAKHDPRILMLYFNATPQGHEHPVTDYHKIVDPKKGNGCYSSFGRDTWNQTKGSYDSAATVPSTAPSTGVNTGVRPNGAPFQEAVGPISGNRSGIKVTFQNGNELWVMHRCGNVVTRKPIPNIPTVPNHPTPSTPPRSSSPPKKCPNGGATSGVLGTQCVNTRGPTDQGPSASEPPTAGCGGNDCMNTIENSQQNGDPSGNTNTTYGTDTGSYDNGGSPAGGNNGDYSGGNGGISNEPTTPPDNGQTSGNGGCSDPAACAPN